MRPLAWIQDADQRLNLAIAAVCLVVAVEGLSFIGPLLRPSDKPREKSQTVQTVVVPRSSEPPPLTPQTQSTRLHSDAVFQVCLASSPVECPATQVFVRCGGDTFRKWAERQCGRFSVEGTPAMRSAAGSCQRSNVRVRCTAQATR